MGMIKGFLWIVIVLSLSIASLVCAIGFVILILAIAQGESVYLEMIGCYFGMCIMGFLAMLAYSLLED